MTRTAASANAISVERRSTIVFLRALAALLTGIVLAHPSQAQTNFKVLYSFQGVTAADGSEPLGALIRDAAGNLYGTTYIGGVSDHGTVFRVNPTGKETVLHSFGGKKDGRYPWAGLVRDEAGNFFGTTSEGGAPAAGTVFRVDPTGKETVLYSFTGGADGGGPTAGLVRDGAGNLYGTTTQGGGAASLGTVFKLDSVGKETVLYAFTVEANGAKPYASLVSDTQGNLYGTTKYGGIGYCCGTVFKVDSTGTETLLYSFVGGLTDGFFPSSGLVRDTAGTLYGTTTYGGTAYSYGTVFKVDSTDTETLLYTFTGGADGVGPSDLVRDAVGNLYGTTNQGGTFGWGTVFKLDTANRKTVLYNFTGGNDGGDPQGALVRDAAGNLYGTAVFGGINRSGVVFELTK